MASIKEIAEMTGLSPATISHVINNNRAVSEKSRQLVNEAIQKTGYTPNYFAKALKKKKTDLIAVVLPTIENGPEDKNISNDSFIPLLNGAQECLYKNDCELLVISYSENGGVEELKKFNFLKSKLVNGILMVPFDRNSTIKSFAESIEVPIVLCDRRIENSGLPTVYANNYQGSRDLVELLIEQGYENIAFIGGTLATSVGYDRLQGYKDGLKEHGIEEREDLIYCISELETEKGGWAMADAMKKGADAVCLSNHILTIGALHYCNANQVDIPDDIALVSMDEYEWLNVNKSGITSLNQDHYSMGMRGAEKLLAILNGSTTENNDELLNCSINFRQSHLKKR